MIYQRVFHRQIDRRIDRYLPCELVTCFLYFDILCISVICVLSFLFSYLKYLYSIFFPLFWFDISWYVVIGFSFLSTFCFFLYAFSFALTFTLSSCFSNIPSFSFLSKFIALLFFSLFFFLLWTSSHSFFCLFFSPLRSNFS